jgi:hypothetical protein
MYKLLVGIVLATILFLAASEAVVYTLNALFPERHTCMGIWIKL